MSDELSVPENGTRITIQTESGDSYTGTIKHRDEYTTSTEHRVTAKLYSPDTIDAWTVRITRNRVTNTINKAEIFHETDATDETGAVTGVTQTDHHTITTITTP